MAKKPKTMIQSLDRAIAVLEVVALAETSMRNTDIAAAIGVDPHTTHNIVRSLFAHGYLAQDENSRYLLGSSCLKLQNHIHGRYDQLALAAREPIRELVQLNGDTTFLGVEYHGSLYCVITMHQGILSFDEKQSWLDCLHATSAGRIIIAEKGMEWFEKLARVRTFDKFTPATITTVEEMRSAVEKVLRDDYALVINEHLPNLASIAIPVRSSNRRFIATLAQSFPDVYLETGRLQIDTRLQMLQDCAAKIACNLEKLEK